KILLVLVALREAFLMEKKREGKGSGDEYEHTFVCGNSSFKKLKYPFILENNKKRMLEHWFIFGQYRTKRCTFLKKQTQNCKQEELNKDNFSSYPVTKKTMTDHFVFSIRDWKLHRYNILITSTLIHHGFDHFLFNFLGLASQGLHLIPYIGLSIFFCGRMFWLVYVSGGMLGNLAVVFPYHYHYDKSCDKVQALSKDDEPKMLEYMYTYTYLFLCEFCYVFFCRKKEKCPFFLSSLPRAFLDIFVFGACFYFLWKLFSYKSLISKGKIRNPNASVFGKKTLILGNAKQKLYYSNFNLCFFGVVEGNISLVGKVQVKSDHRIVFFDKNIFKLFEILFEIFSIFFNNL
ncbi:hypothetical protein RFI_14357, partial [Reticulomyxa filosa]